MPVVKFRIFNPFESHENTGNLYCKNYKMEGKSKNMSQTFIFLIVFYLFLL